VAHPARGAGGPRANGRIDELCARRAVGRTPRWRARGEAVPGQLRRDQELRELVVGLRWRASGVITEATWRCGRSRTASLEGWSLSSFRGGSARTFRDALWSIGRVARPDVGAPLRRARRRGWRLAMRVSIGSTAEPRRQGYLRLRRPRGRACSRDRGLQRATSATLPTGAPHTRSILRSAGGLALGERPGNAWMRNPLRRHPYVANALLDRGVMVETLETAATWTRLAELYARSGAGAARVAVQPEARRRS